MKEKQITDNIKESTENTDKIEVLLILPIDK